MARHACQDFHTLGTELRVKFPSLGLTDVVIVPWDTYSPLPLRENIDITMLYNVSEIESI